MYSFTKHIIHFLIKTDKTSRKLLFVSSRLWDEGKILSPHEELNLAPLDSALRFSLSCFYLQTWLNRHCWSLQYEGRVSYELSNRSNSQWYEHRSAESDGLRFDSSWGAKIFSLSNARERMKNIFLYFFTEPKIYSPSYSIGKTCWKIATGNNQVYLHITFGGIFTIHQGLISCPLHWKTALKISNITFLKQLKNYRERPVKDCDI